MDKAVTPKPLGDIQLDIRTGEDFMLYLTVGGNVTDDHMEEFEEWARSVNRTMADITAKTGRKALTLIDVTHLNQFDIRTTTIVHDLMVANRGIAGKTAIYGSHSLAMTMLEAIIALTKRKNIKLFSTSEEATKWLREPGGESE